MAQHLVCAIFSLLIASMDKELVTHMGNQNRTPSDIFRMRSKVDDQACSLYSDKMVVRSVLLQLTLIEACLDMHKLNELQCRDRSSRT